MKVIALLLLVGAIVVPQTTNACDWVAAYFVFGMDPGCVPLAGQGNDYIKIVSGTSTEAGNECYNETFLTRYTAYVVDPQVGNCGDDSDCTATIDGNGLSGNYEVIEKSGSCIRLVTCTP